MSEPSEKYPRDLEDNYRLNFRSIPEVHAALSQVVVDVGTDKTLLFRGKPKPKRAQIVNALILQLAALPIEEQARIVRDGLERLNGLLAKGAVGEEGGAEKAAERGAALGEEVAVNLPDPKGRSVDPTLGAGGKRNGFAS